jgi:hypothetical protein
MKTLTCLCAWLNYVALDDCCRRQHTILNMKYCVYECPVSLAELCITERQLDFICNVRMFGCLDDQIYDVFWRHRNFTVKITYSRSRFDFPNTLVEPTNTTMDHENLYASFSLQIFVCLAVYRNIFQGKIYVWSQITKCFGQSILPVETWNEWINCS